jgi:hypothetical protein
MAILRDLFDKLALTKTKRAGRQPAHGFAAHYGDSTNPRLDDIKDISSTGLYLITTERWLPGTVISLTVQTKSFAEEMSERRITLQAKCVRWGEDGVGLSFVLPNDPDSDAWRVLLQNAAEQSRPNTVLSLARMAKAVAFLARICPHAAEGVMQLMQGGFTKSRVTNAVHILLRAEGMLPLEIDGNNIGSPPKLIAKIIEYGSWAEEGWIQQLWAGLLATSSSDDGRDDSNQVFADLFSKLAAEHVRVLRYGCLKASNICSISGSNPSAPVVCTREEIMEVTESRELLCIERNLEHLHNLGLLERDAKSEPFGTHYEANITPSRLALQLYGRCKGARD